MAQVDKHNDEGTDPVLVRQAKQWLDQAFEDLAKERVYNDRYYDMDVDRVEAEIRQYTPSLRRAIHTVLADWVLGNDNRRQLTGLHLLSKLNATEQIPTLEVALRKIRSRPQALLQDWIESWDRTKSWKDLTGQPNMLTKKQIELYWQESAREVLRALEHLRKVQSAE